jgi:hypothetical protein
LAVAFALVASVGFLAPIVSTSFSRGPSGYFYEGRCMCGHEIFIHLKGDGYFSYSPGHGAPEHRIFTLKPVNGPDISEWEASSDESTFGNTWTLPGEQRPTMHIRIENGALVQYYPRNEYSAGYKARLPRVHNVWRIWFPQLCERLKFLF